MEEPLYACEVSCRERTRESGGAAPLKVLFRLNPKGFQWWRPAKIGSPVSATVVEGWAAAELGDPSNNAKNQG